MTSLYHTPSLQFYIISAVIRFPMEYSIYPVALNLCIYISNPYSEYNLKVHYE